MSEFLSVPSLSISQIVKMIDNINIGIMLTEDGKLDVSIAGEKCVTRLRFINVADLSGDRLIESLRENKQLIDSRSGCLNLSYYENERFENKVPAIVDRHTRTMARLNCGKFLLDTFYEASVHFIGKGGVSLFSPTGNKGIDGLRVSGFCNTAVNLRNSIKGAVALETPSIKD